MNQATSLASVFISCLALFVAVRNHLINTRFARRQYSLAYTRHVTEWALAVSKEFEAYLESDHHDREGNFVGFEEDPGLRRIRRKVVHQRVVSLYHQGILLFDDFEAGTSLFDRSGVTSTPDLQACLIEFINLAIKSVTASLSPIDEGKVLALWYRFLKLARSRILSTR